MSVSRRAYAKRRGVSERSIRRAIEDGRIAAAILPDGSLDSDRADELLAGGAVSGAAVPLTLSSARRRKSAAGCALLADELDALTASVAPVRTIEGTERNMLLCMATGFGRMVQPLAREVAGKPPVQASVIVDDRVRATLTAIADAEVKVVDEPDPEPESSRCFAALTATELAAVRATMQAEKLEVQRAINQGELVSLANWQTDIVNRIVMAKTRLCGIHAKTAPLYAAASVEAAAAIIRREIVEAFEVLTTDRALVAEMVQTLDAQRPTRRTRGKPTHRRAA